MTMIEVISTNSGSPISFHHNPKSKELFYIQVNENYMYNRQNDG